MSEPVSMQMIIDAIPVGVHVVDAKGILVEVNRAWLIHFGTTAAKVVGQPIEQVMRDMIYFDRGNGDRVDNPWEFERPAALETLKTKLPSSASFHQGQYQTTARPILDGQGNIRFVVTTMVKSARETSAPTVPVGLPVTQAGESAEDSEPEVEEAPPAGPDPEEASRLVGESEPIQRLRRLIHRVAPTDATVLITGPTGVGKEVVADELQRLSSRADRPFVKVNCAAIPENLMEAELFGYEKGAFTGASREGKAGLLELADTGTVLLDEIGEMPLSLQPKLLRAIQERTITRVGGTRQIDIDIRILAATNRDLAQQVEEHRFREDLYYRLNVIPLQLPPLRERGNDVILLARTFLEEFNQKYRCEKWLSPEALQQMADYAWPGNIRELRNLVERMVVLEPGAQILGERVWRTLRQRASQVPEEANAAEEQLSLKEATQRLQREMISSALQRHGSTYKAAEALQVSQSTLVRKAHQLGLNTAK